MHVSAWAGAQDDTKEIYMLGTIVVLLIVALDQIVKFISKSVLTTLPGNTYPLWDGVFHFTYVENRGAAFGIFGGARGFLLVFTILLVGVLIWAIVKFRDNPSKLFRASLYMILGGAIGNLIDRVVMGYVIDMLDFRLINFAVFNVADSFVCVGTVLLIIDILFKSEDYFKEKSRGKKGSTKNKTLMEKSWKARSSYPQRQMKRAAARAMNSLLQRCKERKRSSSALNEWSDCGIYS